MFSDTLPDKYGNKLINTWLAQQGRHESSMNPVEKLCFIGSRGIEAIDCKIEMNECQLLKENGRAHFMTKRFDREGNIKHHIQSLCGLQHYDFNDMYGYSYEQVFQTMRLLRLTYPEAEQMFRRMVFNVLATNYDDHTKNFSFILKKDEKWD